MKTPIKSVLKINGFDELNPFRMREYYCVFFQYKGYYLGEKKYRLEGNSIETIIKISLDAENIIEELKKRGL